jgi:hypothetical protein
LASPPRKARRGRYILHRVLAIILHPAAALTKTVAARGAHGARPNGEAGPKGERHGRRE